MEGVILYADDHIYSQDRPERHLYETLRSEMPVMGVHNLDLALTAIQSIGSFKALILDWSYSPSEDESFDDVAAEVGLAPRSVNASVKEDAALTFLMKHDFYSLIYIFSEDDVEAMHGEKLKEKFGERIKFKRKSSFLTENVPEYKRQIVEEINAWKEQNKHISIPIVWMTAINTSMQKIFKELSEADNEWIGDLYKAAETDGVSGELFVIELLQLLLSESIVQNKQLTIAIKELGSVSNAEVGDPQAVPTTPKVYTEEELKTKRLSISKLFSRLFYSDLLKDAPIMTGDVCDLGEEKYGVIISPECDIRHIVATPGSEFDLLVFTKDSFTTLLKKENTYDKINSLEYSKKKDKVKEGLHKIFNQELSRFHILPAIKIIDVNCNHSCAIDFRANTRRIKSEDITKFERPFKINSPFIQQLRQRYLAHIGRVGTPALPSFVRDWNLIQEEVPDISGTGDSA